MTSSKNPFKIETKWPPAGDQPKAIKKIVDGLQKGFNKQTLLGVTGSGKTFTMAHVIEKIKRPTLVLAHNKTLARQLYRELKDLFPNNRVEFFVSYYDYYQPEAYIAASDTYIEKDMAINPKIEQMRLSATHSLLTREDVIIVASVSCIYGLGNPETYELSALELRVGKKISRKDLLIKLLEQQYERNDMELVPGRFRSKGDVIDVIPGYEDNILRIEMFGDEIDRITWLDKMTLEPKERLDYYYLFPARHFVADSEQRDKAIQSITKELEEYLPNVEDPLIRHRLETRVKYDLELIKEIGHCKGIENYSRHFENRKQGSRPYCLLDYFPPGFLLVVDESHVMLPQVHGMYKGDKARKQNLVDYGFRLPCAFDNRPLKFAEFEKLFMKNTVFVSATPGSYELEQSKQIVEQIIRPTGLVDPPIETHPIKDQIPHLLKEIQKTTAKGYRTLITTLTKRMAEELTDFLGDKGVKVRYLHSEIDTLERSEIIRQLRAKKFDVLVGINLLREGIDIPEVALVAILDADKEGYLRNTRSLIQIIGRAARNSESKVILFFDKETDSLKAAMGETARRRRLQLQYNKKHNITPKTVTKSIEEQQVIVKETKHLPKSEIPVYIEDLKKRMNKAADDLNFELAIQLRDQIAKLEKQVKKK